MAYQSYYGGYYPQYQGGAVPDMLGQYKAPYGNIQPHANDMMIFVLGEVEATGYPVAPGNNVILWDKNEPVIYLKSVNVQGIPSMKILDYSERVDAGSSKLPNNAGIKAEEFEELKKKVEELDQKLNGGNE